MQTVPQADQQLNILRELGTVFQAIDELFWLRGGWAIDFRVGRVLREHEDIDLVALSSARQLLAEKLDYESIGRPKCEKDTASKELLRRLMAEEQ